MTPHENSAKALAEKIGNLIGVHADTHIQLFAQIEALLTEYSRDIEFNVAKAMESLERKAVAQEREACAKVAETMRAGEHDGRHCNKCDAFCCKCELCDCHVSPEYIAAQIRARGKQ